MAIPSTASRALASRWRRCTIPSASSRARSASGCCRPMATDSSTGRSARPTRMRTLSNRLRLSATASNPDMKRYPTAMSARAELSSISRSRVSRSGSVSAWRMLEVGMGCSFHRHQGQAYCRSLSWLRISLSNRDNVQIPYAVKMPAVVGEQGQVVAVPWRRS